MASENQLSSLSAYSALLALLAGLYALVLTERGWLIITSTWRTARIFVSPSLGQCPKRLWADAKTGPLHVCTFTWPTQCHQGLHGKSGMCWERSLLTVVNSWESDAVKLTVDKPKNLLLSQNYLRVDLKVVLAFIFMTAKQTYGNSFDIERIDRRRFQIVSSILDIEIISPDLILLHLEGKLEFTLTKDHVERLLRGYPPLVQDPQGISIFNPGDEARGGWVVALGLDRLFNEKTTFLPVYVDCVPYKDRRGHVFWRSMDRVRRIIIDIWANAFAKDPTASEDIAAVIKALDYIHEYETYSGTLQALKPLRSRFPSKPASAREQRRIIEHFNGPPLIADTEREQFRAEWEPLLYNVLWAAASGSLRCIEYFRRPGRELEEILPMEDLKKADLYLRGC